MKNKLFEKLNALPHKIKINAIVIVLIIAIVWFLLPLIPIGGEHPFSSSGTRVIILLILGLSAGAKALLTLYQQHQNKTWQVIKAFSVKSWRKINSQVHHFAQSSKLKAKDLTYKIKQEHQKRRLHKLPWYLVLGTPKSGRKTTIHNTGLSFARPEHFGEEAVNYIKQIPDFDWWFSEHAVMIDAMSNQEDTDIAAWKKFLKILKKERSNKPINGIILTFSLPDLILFSNQNRQEFIQTICKYIRDLHEKFKAKVPLYIVFNKADQVEGFLEFFNDLSKEELKQVWGITLPFEACEDPNQVLTFLHQQFYQLISHLRKRVMWAFDSERTLRGRELITAFPQQLQLFKRPLETFISELFGAARLPNSLQLRGLYFTSGTQADGAAFDFVLQAMSKKFQLVPPQFQRPSRMGECYFMHNLFPEVIYPEGAVVGESERLQKRRKRWFKAILLACPLLIVFSTIGMYNGYQENKANLVLINRNIDGFIEQIGKVNGNDPSLPKVLPALNQLNAANNLYAKSKEIGLDFLFATDHISHATSDALKRALKSYYLTRIAAQLETQLQQNLPNTNLMYAMLKGYLAFSPIEYTTSDAIKAPMQFLWQQQYLQNPALIHQLNLYLDQAVQLNAPKLPLDKALINQVRDRLEEIIPSNRAYGLLSLQASVSNLPNLNLSTAVGESFKSAFEAPPSPLMIPALYTRAGFETIFLPRYHKIADQVANDNQAIGLTNDSDSTQSAAQITQIIEQHYDQQYVQIWQKALSQIKIKHFKNLSQAITALNILASEQSPLHKLITIVNDNTHTVRAKDIHVADAFRDFNQVANNPKWQDIQTNLSKIENEFIKIQQSPDPNQASFNFALAVLHAGDNPLHQLSAIAQTAPGQLHQWLTTLTEACWQVVLQGAYQAMNAAWQSDVLSLYQNSISGRYPLVSDAESQVAIDNFNNFFGNGGVLEIYFKHYIKPFVNTTVSPWKLYKVDGLTIGLSTHTLSMFEQADKIRKTFFPKGAQHASLNFTLMPQTLDANASNIQFTIGPNVVSYSHGPQTPTSISWPLPFNEQESSLVINDFNANQYSKNASGPWSLFKILDAGLLKEMNGNGTYLFTINFHHLIASFEITGTSDINLFKLKNLHSFRIPASMPATTSWGNHND